MFGDFLPPMVPAMGEEPAQPAPAPPPPAFDANDFVPPPLAPEMREDPPKANLLPPPRPASDEEEDSWDDDEDDTRTMKATILPQHLHSIPQLSIFLLM